MKSFISADELIGVWIVNELSDFHGIPKEDLTNPKMLTNDATEGFSYSSYTYEEGNPATLELVATHIGQTQQGYVASSTVRMEWSMEDMPKALKAIADMRARMVIWK